MPYPNEHACRLRDPGKFQANSFRRTRRESDGKRYDVIVGKLEGEEGMTEQAYRYPKDTWEVDEARNHCESHDGISFEPAVDENGQRELRSYPIEMRVEDNGDAGITKITGVAAVYNAPSEVLSTFGQFVEQIEPGFFDGVMDDDVRGLWNHNTDLVLGRTKSGTLALSDGESGLGIAIYPPDTQAGRDSVTSIRRGDVDQMSFAFSVKINGDEWGKRPDGTIVRTLKRSGCARLYDVSPVTFPAYPQTSVQVRAMVESMSAEVAGLETRPTGEHGQEPSAEESAEKAKAQARRSHRRRKIKIGELR